MRPIGETNTKRYYEPILPGGSKEWPVYHLSQNMDAFIEKVKQKTIKDLVAEYTDENGLRQILELTRFNEEFRIKHNPWEVDPDDEGKFWKGIKRDILNIDPNQANRKAAEMQVLETIVDRYVNEIASRFKPNRHKLARTILTSGFNRLYNAAKVKGFRKLYKKEYTLQDQIQMVGEIDQLRNLATKGTVVLVPTHFSNLDSILIGWIINVLGLPAVIYGAGLNLFDIEILAYFMNSLGAYKIDRRKKNPIYGKALRNYSTLAIQDGCHSLFFPGGTRSRSGSIESKLKLGMLGTALDAQRIICQENKDNKIYIVPIVLNYHFVLEAPSLIKQHLTKEGQEKFYGDNDRYSKSSKMIKFLLKFFTTGSSISFSVGKAMDVFGNDLDENGASFDKLGREIDIKEYFYSDGELKADPQRDVQYNVLLGKKIVKEYHRINRVFSSHLVAFVAFKYFERKYNHLDLFDLLRLTESDLEIPYDTFSKMVEDGRTHIMELFQAYEIDVAPHMAYEIDKVIDHGLSNLGIYHAKKALYKRENGNIATEDLQLLYFYHNRMEGYKLENYV